jgi:hypothetical protein
MAGVTKVNPQSATVNPQNRNENQWEVVGKNIGFFTVDYISDVSGSLGPDEVVDSVYRAIQQFTTIIAAGPLFDGGTQQTFGAEPLLLSGDADPAENDQITQLQNAIQALGTVDSIDLSSATVTATGLAVATSAAV